MVVQEGQVFQMETEVTGPFLEEEEEEEKEAEVQIMQEVMVVQDR